MKFPRLAGAAIVALMLSRSVTAGPTTLTFLTWTDYLDPDVAAEFEAEFDARLEFTLFESDEDRDQTLAAQGGGRFDLILLNGLQLEKYAKRGWIRAIEADSVPHARHVDTRWATAFPAADRYGVAYFWGTMGIAYRHDLVENPPQSWLELLTPDEALRGRILMPESARVLVSFALKAGGHSLNHGDAERLQQASDLLMQQKPYVQTYSYPLFDENSALITGHSWVSPMYNGDFLVLHDRGAEISFVLPSDGGFLWADYLTVGGKSEQAELAHSFINFLNRPEIAARQASYVHFASPNAAARELLNDDFLNDEVVFPPADKLDKFEFMQQMPPRSQRRINAIGARILLDHE